MILIRETHYRYLFILGSLFGCLDRNKILAKKVNDANSTYIAFTWGNFNTIGLYELLCLFADIQSLCKKKNFYCIWIVLFETAVDGNFTSWVLYFSMSLAKYS